VRSWSRCAHPIFAPAPTEAMENPQGSDGDVAFRARVVQPHDPSDWAQLRLQVGDIVYVLEQDETGWWGGHKENDEQTGWFPGSCVRPEPEVDVSHAASRDMSLNETGIAPEPTAAVATSSPPLDASTQGKWQELPLPTGQDCPLETSLEGPIRGVASPQRRRSSAGASEKAPPALATAETEVVETLDEQALAAENARLKQMNSELSDQLRRSMRQSDVDRRNVEALEAKVQQEKAIREELELKVQAESSEKSTVSTEAQVLREQLEREKHSSKAQLDKNEHMRAQYEAKIQETEELLRARQEDTRETVQKERQRARELEEQLRSAQEEITSVKKQRNSVTEAVAVAGSRATESAGCERSSGLEAAGATGSTDLTRRRLFPSLVPQEAAVPEATRTLVVGSVASAGVASPLPQPSGSPGAALRRTDAAQSPGMGHTRSLGDLQQPSPHSGASVRGAFGGPPRSRGASHHEEPPRGCVKGMVSVFEKRCSSSTPRRCGNDGQRSFGPASEPRPRASSRSGRGDHSGGRGVAAPPLPTATRAPAPASSLTSAAHGRDIPRPPAPPPLAAQEDETDEAAAEEVVLGMSPMLKGSAGKGSSLGQGLSGAAQGGAAMAMAPAPGRGAATSPATRCREERNWRRESSIPQVPVAERVRQFVR